MYYLFYRYYGWVFYWGGIRKGWQYEIENARLFRNKSKAFKHIEQGKRNGRIPENTNFELARIE